jgi:Putative peptidoglycan binding domain
MSANGQLTLAELSPAAGGIVGDFAGSGQLASNGPVAAWNAFNQVCIEKANAHLTCNGPSSMYRNLAMQAYFWHLYITGQGNLAAHPGTSNHGLGWATDTPPYVWALMRAYGGAFGWGACSDAPSEAWHRKWCANWHGPDPGVDGHGGGPSKPRYPTLKRGDKGGAVKRAQKHLGRWLVGLHPGKADGVFGPHMKGDVIHFQLIHGIKADGVIGHHTWARLRLVDHFLDRERFYLNKLRLAHAARVGVPSGVILHHPRPDAKQVRAWRGQCAKQARQIARWSGKHGWAKHYRLVRFKQLRHAAGRAF